MATRRSACVLGVLVSGWVGCAEMPAPRFMRADYPAGGSFTHAVAVGDFDGDGTLDLQASNWSSNDIGVLLGIGDGTFAPVVVHAVVREPGGAAAADFNGDGRIDLAVPNVASATSTVGHTLSVFAGAAGGVDEAVNLTVDAAPAGAVAADLDRDGRVDLAMVHWTNEIGALLGNGDGTFRTAWKLQPTDVYMNAVAVADFDGDGIADLALTGDAADYSGRGSVSVCLGNGDGTFRAPATFAAGINASSIAVADFDGDGHPDVAVANIDNGQRTGYATVLLGKGDGTLRDATSFEVGWGGEAVAAGDFNGDGRVDLVVAVNFSGEVVVLLGRGDGRFQSSVHYPSTFGVRALAVADFDGDGRPDFAAAVAQGDTVSVFRNAGVR